MMPASRLTGTGLRAQNEIAPAITLEYMGLDLVRNQLGEIGSILGAVVPLTSAPEAEPPIMEVPIESLGTPRMEVWRGETSPVRIQHGSIQASTSGDLLLGIGCVPVNGDLKERTFELYREILGLLASEQVPHLVRVWNYFPWINQIESLERYQLFCVGRYEAFESAGLDMDRDLPAGSAVGSYGGDLLVVFLASRQKPRYLENPRQISAFHYPQQYGPRSPSFARAALLDDQRSLFISGTASIVGHQTVHVGHLPAQIDETIRNLNVIIERAFGSGMSLASAELEPHLRVYVRNVEDHEAVAERLEEIVPAGYIAYLHADICRSDLLVEIEAFVQRR